MNACCRWAGRGTARHDPVDPANYLVCAPNASFREGPYLARLTVDLLREHPDQFRLVYRSADSRYRIYATVLDAMKAI